jgi:hypothetical protein
MDTVLDALKRAVDELLGRASGPMHLRLIMQPLMATFFAVRAGLRDARQGQSPFLSTYIKDPSERRRLTASAWKDIGKVLVIAILLDTVYQIIALHSFRILQTLIVAFVLAILPYVLVRGPVSRLARGSSRKRAIAAKSN